MPEFAQYAKLTPLPLEAVKIDDTFWSPRITANREKSLPHQLEMIEETGRLDNFRIAAGLQEGECRGAVFNDSDVYKWLEACCYSLAAHPDPHLEAKIDEVVALIAAAQQQDGYLNTYFILKAPDKKWTHLRGLHELYCAGHLIEAAVAHFEALGRRTLLDVACKVADNIDSVFGSGKSRGVPGHEEIELALIKLYRTTGEKRYLRLAEFFIDARGQEPNYLAEEARKAGDQEFKVEYAQAHVPVREQTQVVGHAVRGAYLYSGMADLFAETGDEALLSALERMWQNMVSKRLYITGGLGSTASNEGFTTDYDLPNDTAYAETCASIANIFWNHRMNQITGESRYMDVAELALYNGALAGMGLDGTSYFYANPLHSRGHYGRSPWFGCACCPPNIARLIASLGQYIYARSENRIYVNLFIGSTVKFAVGDTEVTLTQQTDYPWNGTATLTVDTPQAVEFDLNVRIPGWCGRAVMSVNGEESEAAVVCDYANISRTWKTGDQIKLTLEMAPVRIQANPHVEADFGKVALQRGPIIFCLEEADNGKELFQITMPLVTEIKSEFRKDLLGGVTVLEGIAEVPDMTSWDGQLYAPGAVSDMTNKQFVAVPYCTWANRGIAEMMVWLNSEK